MEEKICEDCMWLDYDDEVCHNRESPHLLQKRDLDDTCDSFDGGQEVVEEVFCLIEMPLSQGRSWVKRVVADGQMFYQNPNGGRCPGAGVEPVEEVQADSFDDLDWTKTYLNISENGAGWLDPEARFHGCPFQQHEGHAHRVLKRDSVGLEKQGWVRITNKERYEVWRPLSPEQRTWLDHNGYTLKDDGGHL